MIRKFILHNIKVALQMNTCDGYDDKAFEKSAKLLQKSAFFRNCGKPQFSVVKKSVDARDRTKIFFVYSIAFSFDGGSAANCIEYEKLCDICKKENITISNEEELVIPDFYATERPVVCGFGPCGIFIALILARAGARPIVLERGADVEGRVRDVERYWNEGILSEKSNVQFGEGGAGTFSDGKLLTRINDPLCSFVLETFVKHGAAPDILVNAKPHIGTDRLRSIVKSIRQEIIALGGQVHFMSELTSLEFSSDRRRVKIGINGEMTSISTNALFLAIGHSARNTFRMLSQKGVEISAKAFSVGLRIEHLQSEIDKSLYGDFAGHIALPKGEYALSAHCGSRAVYTFCMCPGGTVVASASENGQIVTNGMSYSERDGKNANCAIAVSVMPEDFGNTPFGAIEFQEKIERDAYKIAGNCGAAPIQTVGGFLGKGSSNPTNVLPSYTGKTEVKPIADIFPSFVSETLKFGLCNFENKIKGFSSNAAVLTAPETRTSSPVKLPRNEERNAVGFDCIYTCGEGAGYAGGITSAAVDGIRCALSFLNKNN